MNISKTQWIIISIVGALAIYYFFIRKTKMTVENEYVSGKYVSASTKVGN